MKKGIVILLTLFIGVGIGKFAPLNINLNFPKIEAPKPQKSNYLLFTEEVWNTIQANYWDKITDDQLSTLFIAATEKITGKPQIMEKKDRASVEKMIQDNLNQLETNDKKKEYVTNMADIVLANLQPFGRSRLYTQKDEKTLSNNVNNISGVNQYEVLGVQKEASSSAIAQAYEEKTQQLKNSNTPEAKQQLAQLDKAYQTLADQQSRQTYDTAGVETTVEYKIVSKDIFYMHILRFSPTTLDDLNRAAQKSDVNPQASTLILDLRDNMGGTIDGLPYFLGPFIGPDQYAYQFYHQGDKPDFKTLSGWFPSLVKFKKTVVLINENSQSTAELMAASLKKYNVGVLVGRKTKGWGTVEKVFPISQQLDQSEKYSIFLVHSLTLREDGQPIESRGVDPTISLDSKDWENQLNNYFRYPELTAVIKQLINQK